MHDTKGTVVYPWLCGSPSKLASTWLGFETLEAAERHQSSMSVMLESYFTSGSKWNKLYWATKPEPWIVVPNPEYDAANPIGANS
jgi:hypothetical protein